MIRLPAAKTDAMCMTMSTSTAAAVTTGVQTDLTAVRITVNPLWSLT
jgi:hypothetical protein